MIRQGQLDSGAVESRLQASISVRGTGRRSCRGGDGARMVNSNSEVQSDSFDQLEGRFLLQNVNGLTEEKAAEIFTFLREDSKGGWLILLLTELNVDWRESRDSLKMLTRWPVHRHAHFSHNTFDRKARLFQPGGVAIVSLGTAAAKVLHTERDPSGLGRWCSVRYQLRSSTLWVIVVYRPCLATGPDTVYQQHVRRLRLEEGSQEPRGAIISDLAGVISRYKEDGSFVVVGGDFNEDIRGLQIPGVREATSRFDSSATYQRGSVPIDGFYTSQTLPVTRGGILPFYTVCTSDHAAVWMSTSVFMAYKSVPRPIRRLQMGNQQSVSQYLSFFKSHLREDASDEEATALMVSSEAQCRRVHTGGMQSSPAFTTALLLVRLWRLRIKRKQGGRVNVSLLIRLETKLGLLDGHSVLSMELLPMLEALSQARTAYKSIRKQHQTLRYRHLHQLALSESGFEAMLERERLRSVFRRLQEAIPSKPKRQLYMVLDVDGSWRDDQVTVNASIVDENIRRFTQTKDTPLRMEPLRSLLGDLAETTVADEILNGIFVPPVGVDPYFVDLLPFLRRPETVYDVDPFTETGFKQGWKKMKEFTGCQGPLHFGHFQAIASDPLLSQWALSRLYDGFFSGASPDRWKIGTDIMIEKKAGVYNVDKLRTILLFQPDFNFGNKVIGRAMMRQAEALHLIPEAQYGSRHGKSASQQLLNKVCLFELSRVQNIPMGYCSTDAKSCYDRIVHSFAALTMRKLGLPKVVVTTMFEVVRSMAHYVSTGFGISNFTYSHPQSDPFQGVGQGNGAGPAIWAAVSAPLLEYLNSRGRGVVFQSPLSHGSFGVSSLAFVDDTDVVAGIREEESTLDDQIIQMITAQVKDWSGVLRVSGGAIVPEKSFYWVLNYNQGKLCCRERGPALSALDSAGHEGFIPFLSVSDSRRTLGAMINPEGTWVDQRAKMRTAIEEWAESSRIANLSRYDAMIELKARVFPKLFYALEVTSFHQRDCRYIMAPALKVGLNLCGVVRTLPRQIVFGPEELLGLGIHDIYMVQGVKHLQALSFYGPMDDSLTGNLIRCLMEEAMMKVGLGRSVLSVSFEEFGMLLTHGWVKTLWRFCYEFNIEVEDWLPAIPLLREHDQYIMRVAKQVLQSKDNSSLLSINKCRLALKVVSLADITFGNGRTVLESIQRGISPRWTQRSNLRFVQTYPTSADWMVWRTFLGRVFPLRTPLGRWYSSNSVSCFLSELEDQLFIKHQLGWMKYSRVAASRSIRFTRFRREGTLVDDLPMGALNTVVDEKTNGLICWGGGTTVPSGGLRSSAIEVSWKDDMFGVDIGSFSEGLQGSQLLMCSDGSFKDGHGTSSWIALNGDLEAGGDMVVPDGVHCAYRSELAGILGGLRFVDSLSVAVLPQEVSFHCDGLSALQTAFGCLPIQESSSHYDLLRAIRVLRGSITQKGVRLIPVHVAGHADDRREVGPLTLAETLNIRMDLRAKAFWALNNERGWPKVSLSGSCVVRWQQSPVEVKDLGDCIAGAQLKEYWRKVKEVPLSSHLDWQSFSKATRLVRRGKEFF